MKKLYSVLIVFLLSIGLLAGCGSANDNGKSDSADSDKAKQTEKSDDFPVKVKDATGDEVSVKEEPKRIVSLIPSDTEIAFALGLGDEMVGVTDNDDYPKEVNDIEKVGGMELNVEKIISLDPDLVLAQETNDEKAIKQIEDADIPVLEVTNDESFDGVYDSISLIGKATGASDKADDVVDGMKTDLRDLKDKAKTIKDDDEKSVYVEISPAPEIFTAGKGTFMDEMLDLIHAKNASEDQDGWAKVNEEAAISSNPDVIVTTYGESTEAVQKDLSKRDGWGDIPAIKDKQIYDVDNNLVSRPGPRLVEGAEELGKAVYPDVFDD